MNPISGSTLISKANKSLYPVLLIFLIISYNIAALKLPQGLYHHEPEIWLSGYTGTDSFRPKSPDKDFRFKNSFEDDYISKNGTDYVIYDDINSIEFTCEADYPITWKFPFPEQLNYIMYFDISSRDARVSYFHNDLMEPVNSRFESSISFHNVMVDFFSANLTCSSVESRQVLESSVYIFLKGKHGIENEGETEHATLEPSTSQAHKDDKLPPLILPCRPASPDSKLAIEKERVSAIPGNKTVQKSWIPLNFPEKDLSFDPKIGFTLQRGFLGNKIFGLYRCSLIVSDDGQEQELGSQQFVLINVTMTTSEEHDFEEIFEPRSILRGKASVHLSNFAATDGFKIPMTEITCCSGVEDKPPKLYGEACESPLTCQLLKESILEEIDSEKEHEYEPWNESEKDTNISSDCRKRPFYGFSEIVICQGENVDFIEEYIHLFHPLANGPVKNRSRRIFESTPQKLAWNASRITSLSKYESSAYAATASISQKILLLVGRPTRRQNIHGLYIFFNPQVRGLLDDYDVDFEDAVAIMSKIRDLSDKIVEYGRDVYYEGESLVFMCFGVKLYYSKEPHLRLNWENGTKQSLEAITEIDSIRKTRRIVYLRDNGDMFVGEGRTVVPIFGKAVNASRGMTSVDCWMPRRNSSKWDKLSKSIEVRDSVAPKFVEKLEENLYFYLGDVGNVITCTVKEALPFPLLKIYRSGKRLKLDLDQLYRNMSKGQLSPDDNDFENGTKEMEFIDKEKNLISIKIRMNKITQEHQGTFECIAKNVNGTVTRRIHVFVIKKTGKALSMTLAVAGILCLVVTGLGLKHWHDKRTVVSLRTNSNL